VPDNVTPSSSNTCITHNGIISIKNKVYSFFFAVNGNLPCTCLDNNIFVISEKLPCTATLIKEASIENPSVIDSIHASVTQCYAQ
jgi:hypothetical protein